MLGVTHKSGPFLCPDVLTELNISYIICVTNLNRGFMTVTTNERGQQNMWAKEPRMYVDPSAALETQWERAEKANGRFRAKRDLILLRKDHFLRTRVQSGA